MTVRDPGNAAQRVDDRRLADAVASNERHTLTGIHGERHAVENAGVAVERMHVVKCQKRHYACVPR